MVLTSTKENLYLTSIQPHYASAAWNQGIKKNQNLFEGCEICLGDYGC